MSDFLAHPSLYSPELSRRLFLAGAAAAWVLPPTSASAAPSPSKSDPSPQATDGGDAPDCDVAIIGGGPSGLSAALALGRGCRDVIVFDAGSPRNARAVQLHNFVTRDGIPPAEFRAVGREQLAAYPSVSFRDERVNQIGGERGAFAVATPSGTVTAKRVILCTGMIDEMLDLPGFSEAWGHAIFQCPYCHGWEVRGQRWGFLARDSMGLVHGFPMLLQGWTDSVTVFTAPGAEFGDEHTAVLAERGITLHPSPVASLELEGTTLTGVVLEDGTRHDCDALFAHPPQRQVDIVSALGLELNDQGFVQADPMTRQTSIPGIYAAGDLTSRAQGAILAAATGTHAAGMANHDLAVSGE